MEAKARSGCEWEQRNIKLRIMNEWLFLSIRKVVVKKAYMDRRPDLVVVHNAVLLFNLFIVHLVIVKVVVADIILVGVVTTTRRLWFSRWRSVFGKLARHGVANTYGRIVFLPMNPLGKGMIQLSRPVIGVGWILVGVDIGFPHGWIGKVTHIYGHDDPVGTFSIAIIRRRGPVHTTMTDQNGVIAFVHVRNMQFWTVS
jgi:hypothetical protein